MMTTSEVLILKIDEEQQGIPYPRMNVSSADHKAWVEISFPMNTQFNSVVIEADELIKAIKRCTLET